MQNQRSLRWRLNQGQLDSPTLSKGKLGDAICSPVFVSHHISSLLEYYVEIGNVTSRRSFVQGRNGRAYLFTNVVNVTVGVKEDRHLMTGLHTVADICCLQCQEVLGWKYEKAYEESQKYKEGKYILEKAKVMKENW
jgi:hypothetical protein